MTRRNTCSIAERGCGLIRTGRSAASRICLEWIGSAFDCGRLPAPQRSRATSGRTTNRRSRELSLLKDDSTEPGTARGTLAGPFEEGHARHDHNSSTVFSSPLTTVLRLAYGCAQYWSLGFPVLTETVCGQVQSEMLHISTIIANEHQWDSFLFRGEMVGGNFE